jgi:chemotaxis protein CheX
MSSSLNGSAKGALLEMINHFVPEVLQTMAGLVAIPGAGQLDATQPTKVSGISGSIGLSGKVHGVVYTAFSENLAKIVAESILGATASDQDVADVVAELTNMITGNLKSRLCDLGYNCSLTIPSVVRGDEITISAKSASISVRNSFAIQSVSDPLVLHVFAILEN